MSGGRLFAIGQAVICINDDFSRTRKFYPDIYNYPVLGQCYIVRDYIDLKLSAILLREISNPIVVYSDGICREAGFWDKRFVSAPLPEELQISNMVTKTKEKETV